MAGKDIGQFDDATKQKGPSTPRRARSSRAESTDSIDISSFFAKELTESGSFDVRRIKRSAFGKLLLAIPVPALLIDKSYSVRFFNEGWGRITSTYEELGEGSFFALFGSSKDARATQELVETTFADRKPRITEGELVVGDERIWARMYFRSVRLANERLILVLVEDLTAEKKKLLLMNTIERAKKEWERTFDSVPDLIAVVDDQLRILRLNKEGARALGVPFQGAVGQFCYELVHGTDAPPPYCPLQTMMIDGQEHSAEYYEKQLGIFFRESASPIHDDYGKVTGSVIVAHDITERKLAEDQIKASLKEKEVLLREIHHRVKNNLQVIHSLLRLQSYHVQDETCLGILKDVENRVRTMALVHNKLYESRNLADLNVDEYVVGLVDYLLGSYMTNGSRIAVKTDIARLSFGVDTAIPLGFIITELVSNCLKHAFPEGREGQVIISLRSVGSEEFELIVEDDGVGIPMDVNFRDPDTLGLDLVNTFADQLDGTIALGGEHGAEVRVRFREVKRR